MRACSKIAAALRISTARMESALCRCHRGGVAQIGDDAAAIVNMAVEAGPEAFQDFPAIARRYRVGVRPVKRRKARVKCCWLS